MTQYEGEMCLSMLTGKVKGFNSRSDYGFIRPDDGSAVAFFHHLAFKDKMADLYKGYRDRVLMVSVVEFERSVAR